MTFFGTGSGRIAHIPLRDLSETTHLKDGKATVKGRKAPLVILVALVAGVSIASVHHLINTALDTRPVESIPVTQAWIARFGTALAFLVKMSFCTSIGAAYVQYQWLCLERQEFRTKDIDILTGLLGSPINLIDKTLWLQRTCLAMIALVFWYGRRSSSFSITLKTNLSQDDASDSRDHARFFNRISVTSHVRRESASSAAEVRSGQFWRSSMVRRRPLDESKHWSLKISILHRP